MSRRIFSIFCLIIFLMSILSFYTVSAETATVEKKKTSYTITIDYCKWKLVLKRNGKQINSSDISYGKENKALAPGTYYIAKKKPEFDLHGGHFKWWVVLKKKNGKSLGKGIHSWKYVNGKLEPGQQGKRNTCGCIRINTDVAKYIYKNCKSNNTIIKIYE